MIDIKPKDNLILLPITKKKHINNIFHKFLHMFGIHYWTEWEDIRFNRFADTNNLFLEQSRRCQICNKIEIFKTIAKNNLYN